MAEPVLEREGNLRLASLACSGFPADLAAIAAEAGRAACSQAGVETYGAACAVIDLPPGDSDPLTWRCQAGIPVLGQPRPIPPLLVEDYRALQALSLPHPGPARSLAASWQLLSDHARAMGWMLRPYWRVSIPIGRAADGHLVPDCVVSVFLDR